MRLSLIAKLRPAVLLAALLAALGARADVPRQIGFQGRLLEADGTGKTGVANVTYAIYDAAANGSKLWSENQRIALTDGYYSTYVGSVIPLPEGLFDGHDRFLQVTVEGEDLSPRMLVASVPYALHARVADSVQGGAVDATGISISGQPVIDANGRLAGSAKYNAGSGISIDPTNTISLSTSCAPNQVLKWNGTAWACAAAGTAFVAGTGLELAGGTLSLPSSCGSGQVLKFDGTAWACAADSNTRYSAGPGLAIDGSNTISIAATCSTGQVLKWNGSAWVCGAAGSNIVAGAGLELSGSTLSLPSTCGTNQILKFDGLDWICANDQNTRVQAGAGLELSGTTLSLLSSCANNQILRWNGTTWACANDGATGGTVTNVTVSAPLTVANGTTTPSLGIAQATAVSAGYLTAADWATFNGKLGSGAAAGGDLSGTLPNPSVAKLQGHPVATTTPTTGQVLAWNGTTWAPAAASAGTVTQVSGSGPVTVANGSTTPAITIAKATGSADGYLSSADWTTFNGKLGSGSAAGGDLAGTLPNPTVAKLQGNPVASASPATGQVLAWNGSAWTPSAAASGTVTNVSVSGPLTVTNGSSTPAIAIGKATSLADGYLAAADFATFNGKLGAGSAAGGDLSGTLPNPTVAKLQGNAVSNATPASGQVLAWNGSAWTPSTGGSVTNVTASGPLTVTNGSTTPALTIAKATASADGYLAATDFAAFSGKLGSGSTAGGDLSGTYPNPTVAKLAGVAVSTTAPTGGQVLTFNGTQWVPGSVSSVGVGRNLVTWGSNPTANRWTIDPAISASPMPTISLNTTASEILEGDAAFDFNNPSLSAPGIRAVWDTGTLIAVDPRQVYEGRIAVKATGTIGTSFTGTFFAGFLAFDATKSPIAGNGSAGQTYNGVKCSAFIADAVPASSLTSGTYTAFVGRVSGEGSAVSQFPAGTRFIRPCVGTTVGGIGTARVDALEIFAVDITAGGDLSGTLPAPTVAKLQGRPVAATAPTASQVLRWNGSTSQWEPSSDAAVTSAPLGGTGLSGSPLTIAKATSVSDGYLSATDFATFNGKLATVSVASGVPLSGAGTSASPLTIAKATAAQDGYLTAADFSTFNNKVTSVAAANSTITVAGTTQSPTVAVNTAAVQARVTGSCPTGQAITGINADGTVTCSALASQRVIRWITFNTYDQASGWYASNGANALQMFGGIAPSNWTDGNYRATHIPNDAQTLKAFFTRKAFVPGNNALINADTWSDPSSTNGRVTAALLRVQNTTGSPISWTPCFYYTSYSGWSEYAGLALNGADSWNSATGYATSAACPALSLPANKINTVIITVGSSPPSGTGYAYFRNNFLGFYNNSLNLPSGLQFVDDLDTLPNGTVW